MALHTMGDSPESSPQEANRLIYAGLLGLAVAGSLQLSDKPELDLAQLFAAYAFAVAIPFLAVGFITDYARRAGAVVPRWYDLIGAVGALASVAGFGALFLHISVAVGVVFVISCIAGLLLVRQR